MPTRTVLLLMTGMLLAPTAWGQAVAPSPAPVAPNGYLADPGLEQPAFEPWVGNSLAEPQPNLPPIPQSWLMGAWNPQPSAEARFEFLFLKVDFSNSKPLATENVLNNNNVVQQQSLSADRGRDYTTGIRPSLDIHLNEFKSIEAAGFYLDGPQNTVFIGTPDATKFLDGNNPNPNQRGFMANFPPGFPTIADSISLGWEFQTYGVDLNYCHHFIMQRGPVSDLVLGVGGRYFWMQENIRLNFNDELNAQNGLMFAQSENSMAGPQLVMGDRVQTPFKRIRASAESKIGFMVNSVTDQTLLDANGVNISGSRRNNTQFSPLFEGNFLFEFFVWEHMTIFSGFQILYIDRVDRAVEQVDSDLLEFVTNQKEIGSLLLLGPRAGIAIHY